MVRYGPKLMKQDVRNPTVAQVIRTVRMSDNLGNLRFAPCTNLAIQPLDEVESPTNELPSPTFVTETVIPEGFARKRRLRRDSISNEAARGMRVESQEEGDKQMVSIPESFVGLLSNARVGGCVHE